MRFPVMRSREPTELIMPDKDKLVQIIRAYCNSDPSVTVKNQGFVYIISGLLHFYEQSYHVYRMLIHVMLSLGWH